MNILITIEQKSFTVTCTFIILHYDIHLQQKKFQILFRCQPDSNLGHVHLAGRSTSSLSEILHIQDVAIVIDQAHKHVAIINGRGRCVFSGMCILMFIGQFRTGKVHVSSLDNVH